ncbi:MAG: alanine--tRNA ligase, partial [Actinobacteria bacterium]|nr:alanine--tRNA ligase [Actinomycetota bacterium]
SIENLINSKIRSNIEVKKHETTYSEAIKQGAIAFFGDKYSKDVRTVEISNGRKFSFELCGGTHCEKTGEIGSFYIVSESSISSGVRRIEAVTGTNADQFAKQQFKIIKQLALDLGVGKNEISKKVTQMNDQIKSLNKKITSGEDTLISQITTKLLKKVEIINNVNCVLSEVSSKNLQELRKIIDLIRSQLDGIVALASQIDGKAVILVSVSNSLLGKYQASDIVKSISKTINGGGGGKKDLAQAGGTETSKLGQALKEIRIFIRNES